MDYFKTSFYSIAFIVSDYLAIIVAQYFALAIRVDVLGDYLEIMPLKWQTPVIYEYAIIPGVFIGFCYLERLYSRRQLFWEMAANVFRAGVYTCFVWLLLFFVTKDIAQLSRPYFIILWVIAVPTVLLLRYLTKKSLLHFGLWQTKTLLVGSGKSAEKILCAAMNDAGMGYSFVGRIGDSVITDYPTLSRLDYLGGIDELERVLQQIHCQDVIIATQGISSDKLIELVFRAQPLVKNVSFLPDIIGVPVMGLETQTLVNEKTIMLKVKNNLAVKHNRMFKVLFDWIISVCGLLIFVPLFILLAIMIFIDSPGKIIFSHTRVGHNGRKFPCYKFRTMALDAAGKLKNHLESSPDAAAEWERDFKLKNDPRVTRVGRFLRATSLDELPQFLNVLKGEMSLVGPRPIVEAEITKYQEYIADYYLVRPGITGWWQVHGRNDVSYEDRVQMDSWYVRNWSLWLDIELLVKTLDAVFAKRGAY
ncbi:MAG: sugar transferase [Negativicutes bacterium]|jgi:undecaprenyl-phosphate galactose phosphotransferase